MRTRARPGRSPAGPRTRASPIRGYSLIELVVVVLVLSVLAGMAVPSLQGLAGSREAVAATRVHGALVHAQRLAMSTGLHAWVVFDHANERVTVLVEDPDQRGRAKRRSALDPLTRAPLELALRDMGSAIERLELGSGDEVEFDTLGAPRDASGAPLTADGTIVLRGGATVRVTRNTGRAAIE
jgi:prepilin-type N-terminal cleavage/methylation domain-containing protein